MSLCFAARVACGLAAAGIIAIAPFAGCLQDRTAREPVAEEGEKPTSGDGRLRLDLVPMTDPESVFVLLTSDGSSHAVRYARHRLTVLSARLGNLTRTEVESVFRRLEEPGVRRAFRRGSFSGSGLSRGDQFTLWLDRHGKSMKCFGFLDDAPAEVSMLVDEVLELTGRIEPSVPAEAYLRSEPLDAERFRRLKSSGRVEFKSLPDAPRALQAILRQAIAGPLEFHATRRSVLDRLASWCGGRRECFVSQAGSGHQLVLYLGQP